MTAASIGIGSRFGRWTVIGPMFRSEKSQRLWPCRCDCGTLKDIQESSMLRGNSKSCGCYRRDDTKARFTTHGYTTEANNKGRAGEYRIWHGMKQRCLNPNYPAYPDYGGRGVTVCEPWRTSFESFLADMGPRPSPRHSIERIDNDKGYEPGNCRWATPLDQSRNRRSNRVLTFRGQTKPVSAWASELGIKAAAIINRLDRGWSAEKALSTPTTIKTSG